jgi:drug/metabolite transporter (DMT)-like permease
MSYGDGVVIAAIAALLAGASFAAGGVLQQREAAARPEREALSFRLILDLLHDHAWLLGIGFAMLSYVLEAIALNFGPLVLVQPLIVTELLFALPISVRFFGQKMRLRGWIGTVAITVGLAVGLVSAKPTAGQQNAPLVDWMVALSVVAGVTVVVVMIGRSKKGSLRSSFYALGAGIMLGTQSALLKATIEHFKHGIVTGLTTWQLWTFVAVAILALVLVQSAYEAGPLASSMPVVDASSPSVAIVFGLALFSEHIRTGPWLAGIIVGLALLFLGIVDLDTSPLVHCLQHAQVVERLKREDAVPGEHATDDARRLSRPA